MVTLSTDVILGFENVAGWRVKVNSAASPSVALRTARTQGSWAYSLTNPAIETELRSLALSSTSPLLAGIGVPGASFAVDIRLPSGTSSLSPGSLRLAVNSASRGLAKVPLGKVHFGNLRPGIFQTISFPITDQVRQALSRAAFNDLIIDLDLTVPFESGEYLFDNLHIRTATAVMTDATTKPPAGYGGSVDFDVLGTGPAEQTFDLGPIQVPDRFRLKTGTAGSTSVELELGYSNASIVATCLYQPDTADPEQKSYRFISCTGGPKPGDIVVASWAHLSILNGALSQRLRAQLARRPLGDQLGANLIPPMPTFWGDEDDCIAAPVAGQVVSTSPSCAAAVAQASQIVDDYFRAATSANPSAGWIVAPIPEHAKRHGDGTPPSTVSEAALPLSLMSAAETQDAGLSLINKSEHLNEGGYFDAYWKLTGGLAYSGYSNTNRATTHLDADFSTHGVLLGQDVAVLQVTVSADSDTGQTVPSQMNPSSRAEAHLYVFDVEYPAGGYQSDSAGQFNTDIPVFSKTFDAPPVRFWIFAIKIGVKAEAGLNLAGGVSASGINVTATPQGNIGAHLWGGVDAFVASGGVDATIDLLSVKIPVAAQAAWYLDRAPSACSGTISGSLDSDLTLSSGGGHVDLVATFGVCPICDDVSQTLFSWPPLVSRTVPILHETLAVASFQLPVSLCGGNPPTVSIQAPSSDAGPIYGAVNYDLQGIAYSNNTTGLPTQIDCSNFSWSVNTAGDTITGTGCNAQIRFASTAHQAEITLTVNRTLTDAFGRTITESGSATKTVTVTPLAPGVYILKVLNLTTDQYEPLHGTAPHLTSYSGPAPDGYIIEGKLVPPDGVDSTQVGYRWTVANPDGTTQNITCSSLIPACHGGGWDLFSSLEAYWNPPAGPLGNFTVSLVATSKATGETIGTASIIANFHMLH